MRLSLDDLAAFHAVVETGSVSSAARRLGLAKSVISKRVKALEASVEATLLKRSTRSVKPTDRGKGFYEQTRTLTSELNEAVCAVNERGKELGGLIRLAAPMSFGTLYLGQLLWPFLIRHPALEVAIDLDDRVVDVLGSGYDLAVRIGRPVSSSLIGKKLADMQALLCASPEYLKKAGTPATLEDLKAHDCIGYAHLGGGQVWQFEGPRGQESRSVRVRGRFVANNGELMRDAAIAGLGLTLLPEFLVREALLTGTLVSIAMPARPASGAVYALYPKDRHLSPRIRALVDHLSAALAPKAPWSL